MKSLKTGRLSRAERSVRLGIAIGLALLFLAVFSWGLKGVSPVRADPGELYVDGASGSDIPTCGTKATPCRTISYTLHSRAASGDTILVAGGTHTENLFVSIPITLSGGYEPVGWTRDVALYGTIIDGSWSPTVVGDWDGSGDDHR